MRHGSGGREQVPAERCGYVFAIDERLSDAREACCWCPTTEGADRCRWHLDADKSDVLVSPLHLDADIYLGDAIFRGAKLAGETGLAGRALPRSDFSGADLRYADLSDTDLSEADLSDADLSGADLSGADLSDADLSNADLTDADLSDADARGASFEQADMQNASLVRTNLRDASIENAALYEVAFSDTWINDGTELGRWCIYETDLEFDIGDQGHEVDPHEAAAWTYRALEQLCRQNALPSKTRWYYVREKDARRKQAWQTGNYAGALKAELSRWVMEYGSNPWRIVGVSLLIMVSWAFLYPITGQLRDVAAEQFFGYAVETPAEAPQYYLTTVFLKSLYFSVVTFATLGYGDIQPVGFWARTLATVETLLGSLLTALLVFVLSRIVTW